MVLAWLTIYCKGGHLDLPRGHIGYRAIIGTDAQCPGSKLYHGPPVQSRSMWESCNHWSSRPCPNQSEFVESLAHGGTSSIL